MSNSRALPAPPPWFPSKIFQCPVAADHVFAARSRDCPFCALAVVSATTNVAVTHPHVAREWHPTKNAPHVPKPRHVLNTARAAVWFQCRVGHEWRDIVAKRCSDDPGCPFCAGRVAMNLELRLGKDVVGYFWHDETKPDQFLTSSDVQVKLRDPLTGVEWTTSPKCLCEVAESHVFDSPIGAIAVRFVPRDKRVKALGLVAAALKRLDDHVFDALLDHALLLCLPCVVRRQRAVDTSSPCAPMLLPPPPPARHDPDTRLAGSQPTGGHPSPPSVASSERLSSPREEVGIIPAVDLKPRSRTCTLL